jgi:hypothetical protein
MNLEDELRETMRAHDTEAPRAVDLGPSPWHRLPRARIWWAVGAAAAAVVAVATLAVTIGGSEHNNSTARPTTTAAPAVQPPRCPRTYHGVPDVQNRFDSPRRLVPTSPPDAAVVCAYLRGKHALTGSRHVAGGLTNVPYTLAWTPPHLPGWEACTSDLRSTDGDQYLLGLRYAAGIVWVLAHGNHCEGAGNGIFSTNVNLLGLAMTAYQSGRWPRSMPTRYPNHEAPVCRGWFGRIGQESAMVPDSPLSVTVCRDRGPQGPAEHRTVADPEPLMRELNSTPASPWDASCQPTKSLYDVTYRLVFRYAAGPPVVVTITSNCVPQVTNGSLKTTPSTRLFPLLASTLRGK